MSAGGSGEAHAAIPENQLIAFGIIGGLVGIYAAFFLSNVAGGVFSFMGALGAICATIWGADAVRRVASYGLGTGVPSIGMLALGMGVVAAMFGLAVGEGIGLDIAGPVIALVVASIIGLVIGIFSNKVLKMNIPVMEQTMTEIAASGTILIIGLSVAMTGTFVFDVVLDNVITTGYIAVIFIAGGMALLHPFNANLGPDEKQDRTLYSALEKGAIAMVIAGIVALSAQNASAGMVTILVGIFIWYFGFMGFYSRVKRDAYKVVGTGLLPSEEELE
ncbi:tetrahydromethanopterin S-methyltransferase subunit MtrC [Methanomethylovorans sp.]|uniref:tetrahydromethanopterin S-methyltransferase subunit MtrC n=1 Tax=Methanomethylovorans sp. TaxID=2758717 RepID=UPI000A870558|nr:tetrahydromethanopterin S-methyltransferase subunit C [Methanomethylovorans sp.]